MPKQNRRRRDVVIQTHAPRSAIEPIQVKIPKDKRDALGYDIWQQIQQGLSDRGTFNIDLDYYNDLYEMHVEDGASDTPWPNASAVFVPLVPKMLDQVASQLAAVVFQPRFFLVNGNTPDAAGVQAQVERMYNAEAARYNWVEPFFGQLNLGLRDGVGVLEVLWKRKVSVRKKLVFKPAVDEESGLPVIDPDTGEPKMERQIESQPEVEFDGVELTPIPLRNFVMFPVWSRNIDEALACGRRVYYSEAELWSMQKAGTLWKDKLDLVLLYQQEGNDERNLTTEGTATITADDQVNISQGAINQSSFPRQRGPFGFWVMYSRQYDMDGDGVPEENVFWIHEMSQSLVGYEPYKYWHGHRPFVGFVPMPRPDIWYGFSVPERLRTLQEELNAKENQRNNAADRALCPPIVTRSGARLLTQDNKVGPDAMWETDNPQSDVMLLQIPDVPLSSYQEVQALEQMAEELLGSSPPPVSGRLSAAQMQMLAQSAKVRIDLMANRLRAALKEVFWQIHQLYIQYGPEQMVANVSENGMPQRLVVDKMTLAQDFDLDIVGSGGPLDRSSRAQDLMIVYTLLMKNPLVAGNLERTWMVTQMLLEAFDRPDIQALIGTREEAEQQQQEQQQMQALQGEMQAQQEQAQQSQGGENGAGPEGGPGGMPPGGPPQGPGGGQ